MDDETQLKVRKFLKRLGISSQQELNQFIENNPDVKDLSIKVSLTTKSFFSKLDFKYLLTHLLNRLLINPL